MEVCEALRKNRKFLNCSNVEFTPRKQQTHSEKHDVSLFQKHSSAVCGALHKQRSFGAARR
jgi:hypothetical protein